ncbi:uncharacterized protein LOC126674204 [Mercurialis annua]|uniref:uncharacterized protein LOC126674204 n=1 Tax=Mercurialis annua TaxID=3986 RepID=UPI0024ACC202|nr:uncharacterized protein LOC126674204 [Mercurialis annua]
MADKETNQTTEPDKEDDSETEKEQENPKIKPRPIVRLGIFLISHSIFFSVICCTAGVLALLLLPVLAKNTYISENALMPGSASSMLSNHHILEANRLVQDLSSVDVGPDEDSGMYVCFNCVHFLLFVVCIFYSNRLVQDLSSVDVGPDEDSGMERRRILARYLSNMGAEVSYHKFHSEMNQFHPLHFFSSPDSGIMRQNLSCSLYGINTVGIIRAPHGDGKESIVLVTPYNFGKSDSSEALSLSIAYSVFSLLTQVTWLAKDVIWLVADSQYGEYAPVAAWLRDYHTPVFTGLASVSTDACVKDSSLYVLEENSAAQRKIHDGFRRAGTMAAALVVKVTDGNEMWDDTLTIYAEASNGQMPNLDLINIVNYLAVHRQGLHVKVQKLWSLLNLKWLEILGKAFEYLGKEAKKLNPNWKFGIPAADYIESSLTLASSLYHQALGIPTGSHGAFRDFQVDAITLEISPKISSNKKAKHNEFVLRGGRLIEGVIRSVNNLLEKFHQSFFLYLLTAPGKFVSVGVYMIAFALLVAPLPLVAASIYANANQLDLGLEDGKSTLESSESNEKDATELIEEEISDINEKGATKSNKEEITEGNEKDIAESNEKDNIESNEKDDTKPIDITFRTWKWLHAAKEVFVIHIWGAIISLLPYFICQMPDWSPTFSFISWVSLSIISLLILYLILGSPFSHAYVSECQIGEWGNLKSVTISTVFIGLLLMSIVNFATAEFGALLIVPTCLLAHPFKLDIGTKSLGSFLRIVCNLILGFISFPPVAFFVSKGMFEGLESINIGDFWNWMESLSAWNSATYIYIGMVHLPCWVLCIHILLHSC